MCAVGHVDFLVHAAEPVADCELAFGQHERDVFVARADAYGVQELLVQVAERLVFDADLVGLHAHRSLTFP